MSKTWKVFFACALGAFIGTLTALQLSVYTWWLGLIVGGLVGYFSYEFKTVIKVVPRAWKAASNVVVDEALKKAGLRLLWLVKATSHLLLNLSLVLVFVATNMIIMFAVFNQSPNNKTPPSWFAVMVLSACVFFNAWGCFSAIGPLWEGAGKLRSPKEMILLLLMVNIITALFYFFPLLVYCGAKYLAPQIYPFLASIVRFCKHLFILLHSDERLLCGMDAAAGALVGFFCGNAIIGAVAGGIIGVLNYEVVSRRILHLVPA